MKQLFFFALIFYLIQSCSINKKLNYQVTANVIYPSSVSISNNTQSAKYLNETNSSLSSFIDEFYTTISNNNVLIQNESVGKADYLIVIDRINLIEGFTITTINDTNSTDNMKTFEIHNCEVSVEYSVINNQTGNEIKSKETGVSKEEEYSNKRTFFEVLFGSNKDNTNYHLKELNAAVFDNLSRKAARRVSAKVTRSIKNDIK